MLQAVVLVMNLFPNSYKGSKLKKKTYYYS